MCVEGQPIVAPGKWYEMSKLVEGFHLLSFTVLVNIAASLAVGMLQRSRTRRVEKLLEVQ